MTRTRALAASLLSFSAAAMLALVGVGTANAAPAPSEDKTSPVIASAKVDGTDAAEYWTADRMRAAIPGDALAAAASERPATAADAVAKGKNTKIKPSTASKPNSSSPKFAVEAAPVPHIGKVFFTMGGFNYVCSGNAVSSANGSTVATAGHCVNEGRPGAFATKFIFVPAYDNGNEPYGKWTARALYTTSQWEQKGDIAFDTGFAVMNPIKGRTLTSVVGGSGLEFGAERGLQYTAYGYPASAPYNGEQLWSCQGKASNDAKHPEFNTQGIPCTMTGGSSGGPWLLGNGLQNSINSYGYNDSNVMYGPYWGADIQKAYYVAEAA